jgi:hypothetical protein
LVGFNWKKRGNAMPKTKKPKTHFDQVPLEIVRKITEQEIPDDEANEENVIVEPPAKK